MMFFRDFFSGYIHFLNKFFQMNLIVEEGASGSDDSEDNSDQNKNTDENDLNDFDRESLLEEFLGEVEEKTPAEKIDRNLPDLLNLTPDDYPPMEVSEELQNKISQLQLIAEGIERKKVTLESPESEIKKQDYKIDYVNLLNNPQLNAVTTTQGPLLVIAGAGSGKTRVIVYRVSYLLENHVDPGKILLLTFTRKAAHEMLTRVDQLLKDNRGRKVM